MYIVLLGKPGSGKGTHSQKLSDNNGFSVVSTGDIIRNEIKTGTPTGNKIESYVKNGELVPDEMVVSLVISKLKDDNIIFDGFPRTVSQAVYLDKSITVDKAILLDVPDEVVVDRIQNRTIVKKGSKTFSFNNRVEAESFIQERGGEVIEREDDAKINVVKNRLNVYQKNSTALINFYNKQNKLFTINGNQSIENVHREILGIIGR